jgi:preprotein translocase subunit SecE
MGRLIRKKTSPKPKKKKTPGESGPPSPGKAKEGAKKPALTVVKSQEGGNKAVGGVQAVVPALKGKIGKDNFVTKSIQFLREVKVELKKVTWPSRKQTLGSTAVVIILVVVISLFLGVVDIGLSSLIRVVIG